MFVCVCMWVHTVCLVCEMEGRTGQVSCVSKMGSVWFWRGLTLWGWRVHYPIVVILKARIPFLPCRQNKNILGRQLSQTGKHSSYGQCCLTKSNKLGAGRLNNWMFYPRYLEGQLGGPLDLGPRWHLTSTQVKFSPFLPRSAGPASAATSPDRPPQAQTPSCPPSRVHYAPATMLRLYRSSTSLIFRLPKNNNILLMA